MVRVNGSSHEILIESEVYFQLYSLRIVRSGLCNIRAVSITLILNIRIPAIVDLIMKGLGLIVVAGTLLSLNDNVVALEKSSGFVSLPFRRRSGLESRSGTVQNTLSYGQFTYNVDITLGTPPQTITVQLDTGSSDLVVNSPISDICNTTPSDCGTKATCT